MTTEQDIPFTRGELLNKLSKFTYYTDIINRISSVDKQINGIQDRIEEYPIEEKYLLSRRDKLSHQHDIIKRRSLSRQRQRLQNKLIELEKSIREDIIFENETYPQKEKL